MQRWHFIYRGQDNIFFVSFFSFFDFQGGQSTVARSVGEMYRRERGAENPGADFSN
jgi:hypothetical protein